MSRPFNNAAQLARLLEGAVADTPPPPGPVPDDDEIELLLGGRLDTLPEADQRRILSHVAADPELARLVAEMHAMTAAEADAGPAEQPAPRGQPDPPAWPRDGAKMRYGGLIFFTRCVFAVAACLTLGLGVWRLVDPPTAEQQQQQNQIRTMGTGPRQTDPGKTDYWDEVQRRRQGERVPPPPASPGMHPRDYALILVGVACLILAIPVAYWAITITAVAARRSRPPPYGPY